MEKTEELLIAKYIQQDNELRESVEEHRKFESALENFNKRLYLTPAEEMEKKKMQKMKLLSKDKIYQILAKYR
ncbi:MAG: hypothetical protein H6Q50_384 [Deltaproteobacteria bacterium]|nr:hypothetical protein [Deltaproteobacteria bacterium]